MYPLLLGNVYCLNSKSRAGKMAQRFKVLSAKPLNSIPGTHIMEGENQFQQVVLYTLTYAYEHIQPVHIHNK